MKKQFFLSLTAIAFAITSFSQNGSGGDDETFVHVSSTDYARVDWDALGVKHEDYYTTRGKIRFYETVSADVRKYLSQTYSRNGSTYKRYSRTSQASKTWDGVCDLQVSGKKTSFIILHYSSRTGGDAKAYVEMKYEGRKLENNTFVSGGKCNMVTQCTAVVCKTECKGNIDLDKYMNTTYGVVLYHQGRWDMAREFWIVLRDEMASN